MYFIILMHLFPPRKGRFKYLWKNRILWLLAWEFWGQTWQGEIQEISGAFHGNAIVTGAAALFNGVGGLWRGDDLVFFLSGEKIKAYLQKGARELPGFSEYPNSQVGYGKLCVRDGLRSIKCFLFLKKCRIH